jgi:imidazolonepropionase-like amidohydrolase
MTALTEMLDRGFTTVRDDGGANHDLARAADEGIFDGPRLLFCGKALSQTGGHGDMRTPGDFAKAFDDAEVRRAARDEIRKGATHLKVMAGGGVASPTDTAVPSRDISYLDSLVRHVRMYSLFH